MGWRSRVLWRGLSIRLPLGDQLRNAKRALFGYAPSVSNLRGTLEAYQWMKAALQQQGRTLQGAVALEIGSGWFPTIPIMMCLEGAKRVSMTDLNVHMDDVTFNATLRFLRSEPGVPAAVAQVQRQADLPIEYLAPFDASRVADGSVDYIVSRTVLEHIPPDDLVELFRALRPKLKPDGLMLHVVDNSDHLEHRDKSISRVNFLTWSRQEHDRVNRWMRGGENGLRHHEYEALFERAGFRIVSGVGDVHEATLRSLPSVKLAEPYASMAPQQIATLTSYFVLGPAPRPAA